jgi:hypothetical protein
MLIKKLLCAASLVLGSVYATGSESDQTPTIIVPLPRSTNFKPEDTAKKTSLLNWLRKNAVVVSLTGGSLAVIATVGGVLLYRHQHKAHTFCCYANGGIGKCSVPRIGENCSYGKHLTPQDEITNINAGWHCSRAERCTNPNHYKLIKNNGEPFDTRTVAGYDAFFAAVQKNGKNVYSITYYVNIIAATGSLYTHDGNFLYRIEKGQLKYFENGEWQVHPRPTR